VSAFELHLPALIVIVPLLAAPVTVLLRDGALAWGAAAAASVCAFGLAIGLALAVREVGYLSYALGSWPAPYGIELYVDSFAALILLIVTGASSAALLIARTSLAGVVADDRQHLFYTAWLLALAGLTGIAVAGDAFNIFVFMEISSLATYVLIAGGPRRQALTAVFKYLILGTVGATFYLIGVGLIYMMTGTLNLADMEARIAGVAELRPILVAAGFITVGLAMKAAVFPLHLWLPGAYTHAPHVVTAFIAACSTKVALYVLLRFDFFVFQGNLADHARQFQTFVLPLAVLGMVTASIAAIFQRDIKRMLAYSSVAQIGYMLFGAGLATHTGLTAGILHMFNHALAKGTLFLAVSALAVRGAAVTLESLGGAARRTPVTTAAFVIAALSLIGIPGTAGFVSKWHLVAASLELGTVGLWLAAPVVASSVLTVAYVWRAIEAAYFRPAPEPISPAGSGWVTAVVAVAAAANVYFGLQPGAPLELAASAAQALLATASFTK
jgi:multicomponent Na+:H+ antiporter subunit D